MCRPERMHHCCLVCAKTKSLWPSNRLLRSLTDLWSKNSRFLENTVHEYTMQKDAFWVSVQIASKQICESAATRMASRMTWNGLEVEKIQLVVKDGMQMLFACVGDEKDRLGFSTTTTSYSSVRCQCHSLRTHRQEFLIGRLSSEKSSAWKPSAEGECDRQRLRPKNLFREIAASMDNFNASRAKFTFDSKILKKSINFI